MHKHFSEKEADKLFITLVSAGIAALITCLVMI